MTSRRSASGKRVVVVALLAAALAAVAGCSAGKKHAEVEGVLVPQADGTVEVPEEGGQIVLAESFDGTVEPPIPEQPLVKLAAHRNVRWGLVRKLDDRLKKSGKKVLFLVGDRHRLRAMQLEDELEVEHPLKLHLGMDGKACLQAPGVDEAKCAQSPDAREIDAAGVRELVREGMDLLDAHDVLVLVPDPLSWADVVRAVDGARTCCGKELVRVKIRRE